LFGMFITCTLSHPVNMVWAKDVLHVYSTGTILEIDRCASAWLIKRFVDKDARFVFLSDDELLITDSIPFDTATARLRRTHNQSTFEVIRDIYKIMDSNVDTIASIIHGIEINFWNNTGKDETGQFERDMRKIIKNAANNNAALKESFLYLDKVAIILE